MAYDKSTKLAVAVPLATIALLLTYGLSIGPVYYLWAAFSADMTTHGKIEQFYAPVFAVAPVAVEYRDVSRIAGHQLTTKQLH